MNAISQNAHIYQPRDPFVAGRFPKTAPGHVLPPATRPPPRRPLSWVRTPCPRAHILHLPGSEIDQIIEALAMGRCSGCCRFFCKDRVL